MPAHPVDAKLRAGLARAATLGACAPDGSAGTGDTAIAPSPAVADRATGPGTSPDTPSGAETGSAPRLAAPDVRSTPADAPPGGGGMRLLEHDLGTGETRDRTPASEPFVIDSGDWTVAPDGRHVAFVSAGDRNIWLIELE